MKKDQFPIGVITVQLLTGLLVSIVTMALFLSTRQIDWHVLFVRAYDFPILLLIISFALVLSLVIGSVHYFFLRRDFKKVTSAIIELEQGKEVNVSPGPYRHTLSRLARIGRQIEEQTETFQKISTRPHQVEQARLQAVTEERKRLARELHDSVSQQLYAISMMTTAAKQTILTQPDTAAKQIDLVETMAQTAQSEMRSLLLQLRPVELEGLTLQQGLTQLLEEISRKQSTELSWKLEDISLPRQVENELFRIVQEGLTNTLRHAKATHMTIELREFSDTVTLSMNDDGIGFIVDEKKLASYGINSMRERAAEIGGTIRLVSIPEKGTQIEVKIRKERMVQT
ncbi:sensor histidine kinase [Exiguobacterium flavidum]|uniref:sensor histidine kinase n=1 Tax=Exiguobacterium flavidum TaxID=2184695 RepID=UPI000DF7D4FE|nr:sensor histidine kinase [Exiguobacterium flavidum]